MGDIFAFGEWVRRRRKALDLTQEQLAHSIGCATITIRRIESDSLRPSREIAERLAECLAIPAEDRAAFVQAARSERSVDRLDSPLTGITSAPMPAAPAARVTLPPTNLSYLLTSFIGRVRELAELAALLTTNRLVTITGIGGVGKTRLALQIANELRAQFDDGVWLVELAPLHDASFIPQAVANVLGVREQAGQSLLSTICGAVRDKRLLLIMDNCEHLSDAAADLIDALVLSGPGLHILATSHEPLNLLGEQLYPLAPLALPSTSNAPLDELSAVESISLFLERARTGKPGFALSEANAPLIAEMCQRLDGLPLAIELAAVQIRRFSVQQLRERLNEPLALLVDGPRNLPRRQQTLRAAIDWSYQLLEPSEQRLFASLSVFAGGWTIDAAQAVGHDSAPESSVAAVLAALLDKSLIRLTDSGAAPRFVMLETIQSYAREQLARSGALEPCHERHAMYYVALAEQSEEPLAGAEAGIWLDRLDQEHDNLRTALSWALDNAAEQRLALALRLCSVLGRFWRMRGYLREGRRWLERVLATTGPHPPALRAKVLWSAGILARMQGDLTAAAELLGEALTLYNGLDDTLGIALALTSLGTLSFEQSDYDRAQTCFEESLTRYQQLGDTRRVGIALNNLGNIAYKKGDLEQAEARYRAALELLTGDAADQQMIALIMTNLGEIARLHKNYRQACQLLAESAEIYRTLNDNQGLLLCLNNLAEIAIDLGHAELAAELLGAMEALYEQLDAVRSPDQASDYERQVAAVRSQLDARVFEAAWRRGRTLPIDDVLKRAVGDDI